MSVDKIEVVVQIEAGECKSGVRLEVGGRGTRGHSEVKGPRFFVVFTSSAPY